MSNLLTARYLVTNAEAYQLEQRGLDFEVDEHNYPAAHEQFDAALDLLVPDDTADTAAQRASVLRNDGFTFVRAAVETKDKATFERADRRLRQALGETALYVSGERSPQFQQAGPHDTPKKPRRELFSVHAATLGLLARLGTAQGVTLGESPAVRTNTTYYGLAHDFARLGTNGYFRVSNAINGARQERINGRLPHTVVWLGRAAYGLAWTGAHDRTNLASAAKTFGRHLLDLPFAGRARKSVRTRP